MVFTLHSQLVGTTLHRNAYLFTRTTQRLLLPDRDAITTNAWSEAYKLSLRSSLEDDDEETILWPRGACACSRRCAGRFPISDISPPTLTGCCEYGGLGYMRERTHSNPVPANQD